MALTDAQAVLVKAEIDADPVLSAYPETSDGAFAIKEALNLLDVPNYTVWKPFVSIAEAGNAFDAEELANRTTGDNTKLSTFSNWLEAIDPSRPDHREFFDDIFSAAGGVNTRAALLALWKRLALRVERVLSTGTGSDASPAIMDREGTISYQEVIQARAS